MTLKGFQMEKEKISENLIVSNKNSATNVEPKSLMSQKFITDDNKITPFVLFLTRAKSDWIRVSNLLEVSARINQLPLFYTFKKATQAKGDGKSISQDGKALKLSLDDGGVYVIDIYLNAYGQKEKLSHTHRIDKNIFDAYITVLENNVSVAEAEAKQKTEERFSLNLE